MADTSTTPTSDGKTANQAENILERAEAALRDVEDSLSGLIILKRQSAAQDVTVASASKALDLAQKRYDSGLVAYYEVLDAQRTMLRSEQEATRIQGERFLAAVLLIKALGGGW